MDVIPQVTQIAGIPGMTYRTHIMLQQRLTTEAGADWVGVAYHQKQMRKMMITLALLVLSLAVVLVRDHSFWFGSADNSTGDSPSVNAASASPTSVSPVAADSKEMSSPLAATSTMHKPVLRGRKTETPVSKTTINSVRVETLPNTISPSAVPSITDSTAPHSPVTSAAERVRINDTAGSQRQPMDVSYPLLAQQSKVEGSVVLQVLISTDGIIQNMRILSGPPILATAAREAVRNWRFKPYLVNGQAVETSATVTVNLTIRVLDNSVNTAVQSASFRKIPTS
jgi:TonB family protein